jgi:hypothetical protein
MFAKPTITDLGTIVARTLDSHTQGSAETLQKTEAVAATDDSDLKSIFSLT